jgi:hypothetical protein
LFSRQENIERREAHFHTALRLESMEAVQRNSQWSLPFQPKIQRVTLHWIKIRRGEQEINQADLQKMRLLEREEGLERLVITGHFTALLLLEDVRPGDVIESCYTIETHPRLLADHYGSFFHLLPGVAVAVYQYSVQFKTGRPMKWKASGNDLKPVESVENEDTRWVWTGADQAGDRVEKHTPSWHLAPPWMQVSDCPDWGTVGTAVARAWQEVPEDEAVTEVAKGLAAGGDDVLVQIAKAVEFVQDEFRYLSVNIEFGGQVPQPPGVVLRKRYGDCKDLTFLLVHILRRLWVTARPILVHSQLRKSVGEVLPMLGFNHVIVEFEVQGQTRWVDGVIKRQGGGALNRFVPHYGLGLPVDVQGGGLIEEPPVTGRTDHYELTETMLLDTSGAASHLSVLLVTKGVHADGLRQQFQTQGPVEFARNRLQFHNSRFVRAERAGDIQHRDDRAANEFTLAEVYVINGFLHNTSKPGLQQFVYPCHLVTSTLVKPELTPRTAPFGLPYPCNVVHVITIFLSTQRKRDVTRISVGNDYINFNRQMEINRGHWSLTLKFSTRAEAVPPERMDDYRAKVEEIWKNSGLVLNVLAGHAHPFKPRNFGALPAPVVKLPPIVPQLKPGAVAAVNTGEAASPDDLDDSRPRHRRHSRAEMMGRGRLTITLIAIGLLVALMVIMLAML